MSEKDMAEMERALILIAGDYTWQRWPDSDDADYIEHLEHHIFRLQEFAINALNILSVARYSAADQE